jgi:hypothetical protein
MPTRGGMPNRKVGANSERVRGILRVTGLPKPIDGTIPNDSFSWSAMTAILGFVVVQHASMHPFAQGTLCVHGCEDPISFKFSKKVTRVIV